MKKLLSLVLSLIVAISLVTGLAINVVATTEPDAGDGTTTPVTVSTDAPNVLIHSITASQRPVYSGNTFELSFTLVNEGVLDVSNSVVNFGFSQSSFVPAQNKAYVNSNSIPSNHILSKPTTSSGLLDEIDETHSISVTAVDSLSTGVHPLTITVDYEYQTADGTTKTGTATETAYIEVKNREDDEVEEEVLTSANLSIENVTASKSTVIAGEEFSLTFDMINEGTGTATNIKIAPTYSQTTFLPKTLNTVESVSDIKKDSTKEESITFKTDSKMATGYYPLELVYTYEDEQSGTTSGSGDNTTTTPMQSTGKYTTYIYISNPELDAEDEEDEEEEDEVNTTPRVILEGYTVDVENIMAGQAFNFAFTLKNTSQVLNVGNMKVSINSADGVFTAVEGSNSFFTQTLNMGVSEDYSIQLNTGSATETKSYPITITVEYEDEKGRAFSSTETINLLVTQPIRAKISNFYYPPESYGTYPIDLEFSYFNEGKSPFYNVKISVEGDFTSMDGEQYVGSLPASSYDDTRISVFPNGIGTMEGVLVLEFEDTTGTEQRLEEPFTINILEDVWIDPGPTPEPEFPFIDPMTGQEVIGFDEFGMYIYAEEGISFTTILLIAGGAGLVAIVVIIIVVVKIKKKKAKKAEDDDEDEDDI